MQELQSLYVVEKWNGDEIIFEIKEKDGDDSVIYEVFSQGKYLFTLSPEGKLIYDNVDKKEERLIYYRPVLIRDIKRSLHI
jgi:hypothetical protein